MPVTLNDIAAASGVTPAVVSQILNDKGQRFSEETRRRVRENAVKAGYRPHAMARSMATGTFGCLALLLSSNRRYSHLGQGMLDGIYSELEEHDLHLTVARLPDEELTDDTKIPRILREMLADGLLINYHYHIPERMRRLINEYHVPSVWINARLEQNCVYPDECGAGRTAAEHLLELGHRRIAFVDYSHGEGALPTAHFSVRDRCEGYCAVMKDAGLAPHVIRGEGHSVPYVERAAFSKKWLTAPDRPTAVITYSTAAATVIALTGARLGLEVPRDLSVVTFDEERPPHSLGGPATSLLVPYRKLGQCAVHMLLGRIANPLDPIPAEGVPLRFVPGSTTAPPQSQDFQQEQETT